MKKMIFIITAITLAYLYYSHPSNIVINSEEGLNHSFSLTLVGQGSSLFSQGEKLPLVIMLPGKKDTPIGFYNKLIHSSTLPFRFALLSPSNIITEFNGWWIDKTDIPKVGKALHQAIRKLIAKYPTKGKPVVIGYKDGADIAFYLGANYGDMYSFIFPIGGSLSKQFMYEERNRLDGKEYGHIYVYHSRASKEPSLKTIEKTVYDLRKKNLNIELIDFDGPLESIFTARNSDFISELGLRMDDLK